MWFNVASKTFSRDITINAKAVQRYSKILIFKNYIKKSCSTLFFFYLWKKFFQHKNFKNHWKCFIVHVLFLICINLNYSINSLSSHHFNHNFFVVTDIFLLAKITLYVNFERERLYLQALRPALPWWCNYMRFCKQHFYKPCQTEMDKNSSQRYEKPRGWTFAIWKLFAFSIPVIIQK